MQNRCFAVLKAIQDGLGLFFGLIQFGKQAFYTINNALLLCERR